MQNIYLLDYKLGPDELNIIGATSPATLFFSNANNLGYVNDIFFANNDKPFGGKYAPLYQRDFEYVKAWWAFRVTIQNFSQLFPEIDDYLALTFRAITNQRQKAALNAVTAATLSNYSTINVQVLQQSNQVEVLGYNLLKKQSNFNGSKVINILSSDKKILEAYTKKVFEQVMGCAYPSPLEILGLGRDSNPKEATSKGGLIGNGAAMEPTGLVLKDSCGHLVGSEDTYASVDDDERHSIVGSVKDFFKLVLEDMLRNFRFDDNFGMDRTAIGIVFRIG